MPKQIWSKDAAALAAAIIGATALPGANAAELLNASYDVARELFQDLNPPFISAWDKAHPDDKLTIRQSHAGSSKQALAILQGLKADVVTFNQVTDIQVLHDKEKLIPADWQEASEQFLSLLFDDGLPRAEGKSEAYRRLVRPQ